MTSAIAQMNVEEIRLLFSYRDWEMQVLYSLMIIFQKDGS